MTKQVLQALEETYKRPRDQLPETLTNESSLNRLAMEINAKSRKNLALLVQTLKKYVRVCTPMFINKHVIIHYLPQVSSMRQF